MRRVMSAAALSCAVVATVLVPLATPTAGAPAVKPDLVPSDARATMHPAVSGNGRYVAFASDYEEERTVVQLRDLPGSWTMNVPAPDESTLNDNSLPSVSGDGSMASYVWSSRGLDGSPRIYTVSDLHGSPQLHRVTGTPNDLPYQRICAYVECTPRLSEDGRTLVAPVLRSLESDLELSIDGTDLVTPDNMLRPMIDFGTVPQGRSKSLTLQVTVKYNEPVAFPETGPVLLGGGEFAIVPSAPACAGAVAGRATCNVTLTFTPPTEGACFDTFMQATLKLPGNTPAGQTALSVVGNCSQPVDVLRSRTAGPSAAAPSCSSSERPPSWYVMDDDVPTNHAGIRVLDLAEDTVGSVQVHGKRITNNGSTPVDVNLYSVDCQIKLVRPEGAENACMPGEQLAPGATCLAYLQTLVDDVVPIAGYLKIGADVFRVSGQANQDLVVAWRDPTGQGDFARAGPPTIVSVEGPNGKPMQAWDSAVSADGRYVAFVGRTIPGQPASMYSYSRVYVHDTDAAGDRTYQHGSTILASLLPNGQVAGASGPSISADGKRVAFHTNSTAAFAPAAAEEQVYVRDLGAQKTVLASVAPDGTGGDQPSGNAALSADGRSVAFESTATNLVTPAYADPPERQVYLRTVDRDFAGTGGTTTILSVDQNGAAALGTPSDSPSISRDGAVTGFESDGRLHPDDGDENTDVYVVRQTSTQTADPAEIDFGPVPARTRSAPRVVTISNSGGPVTLRGISVREPFELASDHCSNATLYDGESCTFSVVFAPTQVGSRTVVLEVYGPSGIDPLRVTLTGTGTSDATTPGETRLASVDSDPARALDNSEPAISNDGRYVAFLSTPPYVGGDAAAARVTAERKAIEGSKGKPAKKSPEDPAPRPAVVEALTADAIHLRDQVTGTTERLSLPEHVPATGPDVSGDAQLVSYLAMTRDESGQPLERTANVYAVNRQNSAASIVRAVTGTPSDLPYQRTETYCGYEACTPRLSDDGTSIVFSARQEWYSSSLALEVPYQGGEPRPWSLVDFAPTTSGAGPYRQQVTARAYDTVDFLGGPVVDGGEGTFRIIGTTCGTSLAAGQTCTIDLDFVAPRCGETFTATLRTQGRIPAGQTAVALVGTLPCPERLRVAPEPNDEAKPAADAPNCDPIPAPVEAPSPTDGTQTPVGNVQADSMYAEIGEVDYVGLRVTNDTTLAARVLFETPQCGLAFVTPEQPDPAYPTCTHGQDLAPGATCTAYVGFKPDSVGTVVANLQLYMGHPRYKVHRFVGEAHRDVVLMRRDSTGAGDFAGAGSPAPEVVSLDGNGASMNGASPVVSADGRYVAYLSDAPVGRDADPDGDDSAQLYRRDRIAKTTELVSQLPDGSLDEFGVGGPSMSRDGSRVAFQTVMRGEGPTPPYTQVYVRDVESGRTVLASAAHDDPSAGGNSDSYDTSLSDDGTTVAFASVADNLTEQPTNGDGTIFVREVERDFARDAPRDNELVSVTNQGRVVEGSSYGTAVNDDGAFVAFGSAAALVPEDTDENAWDVYVRRRFAQLVVEPAALDFGAVRVGQTSGPERVTVRNVGLGPADIGTVTAAAPFAPGAENCAKLRRGKSCTVDATFAPTTEGTFSGALDLPVSQGYLRLPAIGATLAGVGTTDPRPTPRVAYDVAPLAVDFGDVTLGKEATPGSLTVRNTGQLPLAMAVTTKSEGDIGDFAADGTPCAVLMPAQSCVVPVRFAPRAKGVRNGTVTFTADAQDPTATDPAPVEVSLTGEGVDPATGPARVATMTVTPTAIAFPTGVLNIASAAKRVTVRNVGDVPLAVAGEVRSGATEFYSRSAGCLILMPGRQCTIDVRFAPRALGSRVGALTVLAASIDPNVVSPFPVNVALTGSTRQPRLVLDPVVGHPGQVTMVRGENFPPAQQIALSWQIGLGTAVATPDATGVFTAPMLVFRRDQLGERLLAAAIPSLPTPTLSEPYLVERLSAQPPGFVARW